MRPEFDSLRNRPDVSVLIVGAGINGIGLFRELALQGIDCLLVEKSDFCSGTRDRKSTRLNSSHLGISYAVFCLKKCPQSTIRCKPVLFSPDSATHTRSAEHT